jgi:methionine sulfoxide reductase heme-binding subunit
MKIKDEIVKFMKNRRNTYLCMGAYTLGGCGVAALFTPPKQAFMLGSGYTGLSLMALTLLIGPFNLMKKRSNPVNIMLRRDVGIWAGAISVAHFILHTRTEHELLSANVTANQNFFEVGHTLGLLTLPGLLILLATSNQVSLRWLKGKRWKNVQRLNYLVMPVIFAHVIAFQLFSQRNAYLIGAVILLGLIVLVAQVAGAVVTLRRIRLRRAQHQVANPMSV